MEMIGMMGSLGTLVVMLPFMMMGLVIPLVIYLVARWRNERAATEQRDSQIGLKVALYMLQVVGFQIGLLAVFLFLLAVISEMPTADFIRIAIGLGLPAAGVFFIHKNLAAKTNTESFPNVRRMFQGWNMLITAMPGFASFLVLSVVIFADLPMEKGDVLRVIFPYVMTYGGAWVLLSIQWFKSEGLMPQGPAAGSYPQGGGQVPMQGGYQQPQGAQQPNLQAQQAQYQQQQAAYQQQVAQQQPGYQQPAAPAAPQPGGTPPAGGYPPQG